MNASEILAAKRPEQIFPGTTAGCRQKMREIAREWHPDRCKQPEATAVFSHVSALYESALRLIEDGEWAGPFVLGLGTAQVKILRSAPFELGRELIGERYVLWKLRPEFKGRERMYFKKLEFGSGAMATEMARRLPANPSMDVDGLNIFVGVVRPDGFLPLSLVMKTLGDLDPKQVAWIGSSMLDVACYLSWARIVHGAFSPENFWVSPKDHGGALLGGWFYAGLDGKRLSLLPRRSFDHLPWEARRDKVASPKIDLDLIRLTLREALGKHRAPGPMDSWLKQPSAGNALLDYYKWTQALERSFGPRIFVKMELNAEAVLSDVNKGD